MKRAAASAVVLSSALACAFALAAEPAHHWSYSGGTGPSHWGAMEEAYEACGIGKMQSPIDIQTARAKPSALPAIAFDYHPSPLRIVDNGHTVQVDYAPGSFITVGDDRYQLIQFHFHKPSEEKLDGKPFDMVVHLVHRDAQGRLAVVAVPLSRGAPNHMVDVLWSHLPREKGREGTFESVAIDASTLLPPDRGYYAFEGSLTTPPCSEGVRWFVLKSVNSVSAAEISTFGKRYPMNARPVQPLNGRQVLSTK